jgi:transcriptional regulator with XRE-family HTH domain
VHVSTRSKPIPASAQLLDAGHLVARVKSRRRGLGLSLRDAADAIGVSAATLSRIESGGRLPGRETLLRIAHWLGVGLDLSEPPRARRHSVSSAYPLTTVEAVELRVRTDRDLAPADAEALTDIFRIAYERLRAGRRPRRTAAR